EKAADLLNVPGSLLWLCEGDQLEIRAASDPQMLNWRVGIADSATGGVIRSGEAALSPQAAADLPGSANNYGPGLIVPLFMAGESTNLDQPIGAISILYHQAGFQEVEQAEWDKNVLNILGHYVTLAMQNAAHREAARIAQERHTVTEAFAAIGDIASNLLHQLNNKIGTIPVRIEGIEDKCAETLAADAYLSSNLSEIKSSATQAIEIVRENLFHLRPIRFSAVGVAEAVESALAAAHLPAGVQVWPRELATLPKVHACSQRLPLVFLNLFDNAARAMQGAGEIWVSGKTLEGKVEIRVRDSGPGIPVALHERIFEFNYSSVTAETRANLGFGLWWVKTLMARFGGLISVESDGQAGTTFVLEFPQGEEGA
ncbi:MAG TPA: hypothetical protein DEH25_04775, partial [Chloroflexi bacterium]|nr:hypothetical protein [Chloroflexota bacterium]